MVDFKVRFNLNVPRREPYWKMTEKELRFNLTMALIRNGGKRQFKLKILSTYFKCPSPVAILESANSNL